MTPSVQICLLAVNALVAYGAGGLMMLRDPVVDSSLLDWANSGVGGALCAFGLCLNAIAAYKVLGLIP